MKSLQATFQLSDRGVVGIVGAGGKTTLMFRLAKELSTAGSSVLTTTTTKIYHPTAGQSSRVVIEADPMRLIRKVDAFPAEARHITAAAGIDDASGKLLGYTSGAIGVLWKTGRFQWILVEADGAAGKPLKAPAAHEPVIPGVTTVLVAVAGLDAVGKPLTEEWVFRSRLYALMAGCSMGTTVTPESVYEVLTHPDGILKGCPEPAEKFVLLNSARLPFPTRIGRKVGAMLAQRDRVRFRDVLMGNIGDEYTEIESLMSYKPGPEEEPEGGAA